MWLVVVPCQVWDTGGKFPFKSITEAFFGGAVGAMLVYDISRRSTFDDIVTWLALIRQNCHQSICESLCPEYLLAPVPALLFYVSVREEDGDGAGGRVEIRMCVLS